MAVVTLQVLEGMERGRSFDDIATPFTIGREEDNLVQLNDERVSRFHLKIQEDAGQVILTDLESTNGTRVNGVPTQLRALQVGDLISIGRCLLVFGSQEQIAERFRESDPATWSRLQEAIAALTEESSHDEFDRASRGTINSDPVAAADVNELLDQSVWRSTSEPPPLPTTFRLAQQAQLADLITYLHQRLLIVLNLATEKSPDDRSGQRVVDGPVWQQLIELEMRLAQMLREISNPDEI